MSDDKTPAGEEEPSTGIGRAEIQRMMRDEIARSEVRAALERRSVLRHPIIVTIFGFLLTFVIGSAITSNLAERQEKDQLRREALEAVRDFSRTASERTERMTLLTSALSRDASKAVLSKRKQLYDDSYVEWNANLQRNYLYFREAFGYTVRTFAEYAIDQSLGQIFNIYDHCLTEAYDAVVTNQTEEGYAALNECLQRRGVEPSGGRDEAREISSRLRLCRDQIYEVLNHYVMKDIHCGKAGTWRPKDTEDGGQVWVIESTYQSVLEKCGMEITRDDSGRIIRPRLPRVSESTYRASCTKVDDGGFLAAIGMPGLSANLSGFMTGE